MEHNISHSGIIVSITPEIIKVEIINKSMCAECHAKGICAAGDSKTKIIEVKNNTNEVYSIGERVNLIMKEKVGLNAVLISYIIPLIIIVIFLLYLPSLNINELTSGLIALGFLTIYYLIIYFCRNFISSKFGFTIEKIIE